MLREISFSKFIIADNLSTMLLIIKDWQRAPQITQDAAAYSTITINLPLAVD
jgi:hypothetical protein